jgi:hypothetical protein
MHILQWVATKADNIDEAYNYVESNLEQILNEQSPWYDWYVVGGGRYNMTEDEEMLGAYKEGKTNMIISSNNLDEFNGRIQTCIEFRIVEFDRYRDEWNRSGIDINAKLDTYDGKMQYDLEMYPLSKMIDMIQGEWDMNSYFYDIENWSTNPIHMQKDIEAGEHYFLVPVDFHF